MIYSCSVNLLSVSPKIMGAFLLTFLATELRVIGHALCSFANKIGNAPWHDERATGASHNKPKIKALFNPANFR